jgi:hypothetical protein
MSAEKFEVLNPIGEPGAKRETFASRVQDFNGKTICAVSNGMFRAESVLSTFGELIKKRYPAAKFIPWTDLPVISVWGDVDKSLKELKTALQQKGCDAVIASTGA